jgi:diketogulonate reductase-like aldo/keto reductase
MLDNRTIPQLGFGVFQVPPEDTARTVIAALDTGYRLIDTAQGYHNEEGVGQALTAAGRDVGNVFVTTKLTNSEHGYDKTITALRRSMSALQVDLLDLFLIHWPLPARDLYVETWKAFIELQQGGVVASIGVSNFPRPHLQRLIDETGVVPVVNQIELHPRFPQSDLRAFHAEHGILTQAWSPLGQGGGLLDDPVLSALGKRHGKTAAQVVLRWHVQLGNVVIPKTVTPARMKENMDIFDFELDQEDMRLLSTMDTGDRIGPDPQGMNSL